MKQHMELVAKSENYEEAARLRDSLKSFEEEEPVLCLWALMKEVIANDKFTVLFLAIYVYNTFPSLKYVDDLVESVKPKL
uniref:Polymerase delta-interacting protein 2-like n=1 Tax=Tanacetum cinerariifolium TaxID=118510 RepID=A0A6L2MRY2_TANCI|nr:polymerase delta-interacting protein 2-like [Tanacetum cinerariifolium]